MYLENVQNGLPVIDFDGSDLFTRSATNTTTITQPFSIITVVTRFVKNSNTNFISRESANDSIYRQIYNTGGSEYRTRADNVVSGGDSTAPLILTSIYDGANSKIRGNGTQTGSGNAGTNSLASYCVAGINGNAQLDGAIGEMRIYDVNIESTGDLSSEESVLANKWGISI
jgi:hypothetical protein